MAKTATLTKSEIDSLATNPFVNLWRHLIDGLEPAERQVMYRLGIATIQFWTNIMATATTDERQSA